MRLRFTAPIVLLSLSVVPHAAAQPSYEVVHEFAEGPTNPFGQLIEASDGLLYGTTVDGGEFGVGTVFSVRREVNGRLTLTTVHSFNGADGSYPLAGVIEVAGDFYGTTLRGGAYGRGTVFRMSPAGTISTIHSFNGTDGSRPLQLIRARDGDFYGMTDPDRPPPEELAAIYKVTADGTFTLLHMFGGPGEGFEPTGALVQGTDGNFYGSTLGGGARAAVFPAGTIFKMTAAGQFTTLHTFGAFDFNQPRGGLIQGSDGNFYGSTLQFGSGTGATPGAAFRMTPQGDVTFLHTFTVDEGGTGSLLFQADDGNFLVGTNDTLFTMTPGGTLASLHKFSNLEGEGPRGTILASDGRVYGVLGGGLTNRGAVFAMTPAGSITAVNPFVLDDAPLYPVGRLVPAGDGSFYGTSCLGGRFNAGAIFKVTPAGTVTTRHSFSRFDGVCPLALVRAADGQYYGVAFAGGLAKLGTIFKMTSAGALTVLHTFGGADGRYLTGLMQANDGTFYGTARGARGLGDPGSAFRITGSGEFTTLHFFTGGDDGCVPAQEPVQAADGNFYGTTVACGVLGAGTIFSMTPGGVVTTLSSLGGPTGISVPAAPLLLAADGKLYGTTRGADLGTGSLFVTTTAGDVTRLHTFTEPEGEWPRSALIQGTDGDLYGTTFGSTDVFGNVAPLGSVYKATTSGTVTVLHTFALAGGAKPAGPLTQAGDGAIYGMTFAGGTGQRGVVFRLVLNTP